MTDKKDSNNLFDNVHKKTNVTQNQLKSIASQVHPKDLQNEKQVRALIAQIAAIAGVPVSKEKEDQIVNYLVKSKLSPTDMQKMIKTLMQPKK